MKIYKQCICFLTILVLTKVNFGQSNYQLPVVIPPSPQAAAFARYGEIPVDYSTGVPKIEIPIFNLKAGKLELPITLSYHASGIKVNDFATPVGLGWVLNGSGVIARTVYGQQDESVTNKPYKTSSELQALINNAVTINQQLVAEQELKDLYMNSYENQSDRFVYNFNGHAGVFRYDFVTDELKTIPFAPLKISRKTNAVTNAPYYEIITEDGTIYIFKDIETTMPNQGNIPNYSYYLSQIIASDNSDVINFTYQQSSYSYTQNGIYSILNDALVPYNSNGQTSRQTDFRVLNNFNTTTPINLIAIESNNTKVQFNYSTDRLDKIKEKLNSITVIDITSTTVPQTLKTINFTYSYFGTAANKNQRLKLDNVFVSGPSNAHADKYTFNYNNKELPPYPGDDYNAPYFYFHEDYWGYYNGSNDISNIPTDLFDPFSSDQKNLYGSNRNPSPNLMDACMIQEVVYPTGGKTVFEFEPNNAGTGFYPYTNSNNGIVGGLRIKKLSNYSSATSAPVEKSFEYQSPVTPIDGTIFTQAFRNIRVVQYPFCACTQPNGQCGMCYICHSAEHHISTSTPSYSLTQNSGSPVIYTNVIEYEGTPFSNSGKKEQQYFFTAMDFDNNFPGPRYSTSFHYDRGIANPKISKETIYKNTGTSYEKIGESIYQYSSYNVSEFNTGIKIDKTLNDNGSPDSYHCGPNLNYIFSDSKGYQDNSLLTQRSDYVFSGGTALLQKMTIYDYNVLNILPKTTTTILSNGSSLSSVFKYPSDFPSQVPYSTMVQKNMISAVIDESKYKNGTGFLTSTKTNYNYWWNNSWGSNNSNSIIVPQTIESKTLTASAEIRVQFNVYDNKGNILELQKINDFKKVYLWGYNKTYPVAEIAGTDYATANSYITQSILDNPVDDVSLRSHLNNLRSIPNALVTTYTYKPLVGITSVTDPNNKTTYYEYDAFNRLILIRDKDNNILKKICYNYAGQPETCVASTAANWQQTGITRCKPCAINTSYTTNMQQHQEKDANVLSATYNTIRWIDDNIPGSCSITADWQIATTAQRCQVDAQGANTGYQEQEYRDMNPCSATYNTTTWLRSLYNTGACPLPVVTSTVPVTVNNLAYAGGLTATFTNVNTGAVSSFTIPQSSGLTNIGTLPAGTYNLSIAGSGGGFSLFYLFSYDTQYVSGTSATFNNISAGSAITIESGD